MKARLQLLIAASCAATLLPALAVRAQIATPSAPARIKAIVYHDFGSPEVLRMEEIEKPVPSDNQLLIKVRGVSVNPLDWHFMEGTPYIGRPLAFGFLKPTVTRLGVDFAGTVEAVGKNVTAFKPGDEVYGNKFGAFAEYVVATDKALALKPTNLTFEQAASVPVAAVTALQALRDNGKIQPGQKVLINGASGGVGTFAVQIAKTLGAEVTGVCSGRNAEMVRALGADHVIDYTREDFTKGGERYDLILDNVGNQPLAGFRRVLNPRGIYVMIGGGGVKDDPWFGALVRPIKSLLLSRFISQRLEPMLADMNRKDLTILADLIQTGKVKPVIDKTYAFNQLPEAMRYLEEGHARGKVVITVGDNIEPMASSSDRTAGSSSTPSPLLIALELMAIPICVLILPIIAALVLNRRFKRRHPDERGYRWGYYFSIMSVIAGLVFGLFLESRAIGVMICGLIYAVLASFFIRRYHWAWIALTLLSFNPIAWMINAIYLWKRWKEEPLATGAI